MTKVTLKEQIYVLLIKLVRAEDNLERIVIVEMISELIEKL